MVIPEGILEGSLSHFVKNLDLIEKFKKSES